MTEPVASPCTGVCTLDPRTRLCRGCWRTLAEIAAWPTLSDADQRDLLTQLSSRRKPAYTS